MALVESLRYLVSSDSAQAQSDLKKLGLAASDSMSKLDKLKNALALGAGVGAGAEAVSGIVNGLETVGRFAVDQIGQAIGAASDLQQSAGAVKAIFGSAGAEVTKFGKDAADAVGLSNAEFQQQASVIGALLQNLGQTREQAAATSTDLIKIGADLSATFGGRTAEAVDAISAALRGERDPIERYGISIKQAAIDQEVLRQGLDTSTAALKTQAEATAALSLIRQQAASSTGAFARESDTLAGQQQRFNAELQNARAELGEQLLPAMTELVKLARDAAPAIGILSGVVKDFSDAAGTAGEAAKGFAGFIGSIPGVKQLAGAFGSLGDSTTITATGVTKLQGDLNNAATSISGMVTKLFGIKPAATDAKAALGDLGSVAKQLGSVGDTLFGAERAQTAFNKSLEAGGTDNARSRAKAYESALRRIDDATRSVADAQRNLEETQIQRFLVSLGASSDEVAEAQINERDSTRSLAEAKLRLIDAQQALNRLQNGGAAASRLEAQAAFLDAQKALAEAQQSGDPSGLLKARAALLKAQQGLDDTSSSAQARDLARAKDTVAAAEDGVTQAAIDQRKAQKDLNETLIKGKEGSKELRDADRDLEDAKRRLEDATRNLDDAQDGLVDALNQTSAAGKTAAERFDAGVKAADSWIKFLIDKKASPEEFAAAIGEISSGLQGVATEAGKTEQLDKYIQKVRELSGLFLNLSTAQLPSTSSSSANAAEEALRRSQQNKQQVQVVISGRTLFDIMLEENSASGSPLVTRR